MRILQDMKRALKPDPRVRKVATTIITAINASLKKHKVAAKCKLGGSLAKGTNLKDNHDVDIFVLFEKKVDVDVLEKILPFPAERVHGSRDYFQFEYKNIQIEVVPVKKISKASQAENVTDVSPLHVDWIKSRLQPGMTDEIRLTKQFLKAQHVYGAESYISGFSGHVVDILMVCYGNFLNLLEDAQHWTDRVIIDVENHLKNPLQELNKSKIYSPLIVVDPIQLNRNAAAALNKEKFELFKKSAKQFLAKPTKQAFIVKQPSLLKLKKEWPKHKIVVLNITPLLGKRDVVGAKLLKAFTVIARTVKHYDFPLVYATWTFNKFFFVIEKKKLSSTVIHQGPPLSAKSSVVAFKKKHKNTKVKNNRIIAILPRKHKTVEKLIKELITDDLIKQKVKRIKL